MMMTLKISFIAPVHITTKKGIKAWSTFLKRTRPIKAGINIERFIATIK
jgi:hypothetical protein